MVRNLLVASALALSLPAFAGEAFHVDPDAGKNNFSAVFDATFGERINAVSSKVACDVTYDEKANSISGTCSVPLTSVMVDNNSIKSEHFQQWATNKKMAAKDCKLEARFENVKLDSALEPQKPATFKGEIPFTVCGRAREDGGKEKVTGAVVLFPAGTYAPGASKTLRARAKVEGFNREKYHIGPKWTDGWAARVQTLASVVASEGTIDLSLFAISQAKETTAKEMK